MMSKKGGIFHYVPHADRAEWEEIGWVLASELGSPHGEYSALYKWAGKGKPIVPYLPDERDKELSDLDYVWPDPLGGDGE